MSYHIRIRAAAIVLSVSALAAPALAAITTQEEMNRVVGAFYGATTLDDQRVLDVSNAAISKDIATFTLKKGSLYLTKPVEGMVVTAVFLGEGTAAIKPTRRMDRTALDISAQEHLGKKPGGEVSTSFDRMVLVSFDGSLEKLAASLTSKSASPDLATASSVLKDRLQMMYDLELSLDLELLAAKSGIPDGPAFVSFKSADYGWLEYGFDARETLEVILGYVYRIGTTVEFRPLIRSHAIQDLDAQGNYVADPSKDQKLWIDVTNYKLDITIPDTKHYLVEGEVTFTALKDNLTVVPFTLVNNVFGRRSTDQSAKQLHLKAVMDSSGAVLPHVHLKHQLWVIPPQPLKMGDTQTLRFSVDAETIRQISSVHYFILNDAAWYPQHGYLGSLYTMDWTVKAKKPLVATGSGKMVKETSDGSFNVTQLVFEQPVWLPFLIFGQYQKLVDAYKAAPGGRDVELAVYSWPKTTFSVEDPNGDLFQVDVTVPGGKPKDVLAEAKEIIKLFEGLYGPFPFSQLQVAQMSPGMGFAQGPAGFVQLTGEAFMSSAALAEARTLSPDFFHEVYSHEIAHQYWAHMIKWATDEDVWLSESFAEYTAGLYVMGLLGQERFQGKMRKWRDNAKIADPHGPIAWANNVRGQSARVYGRWLLYDKGPYVVHMLRMQVGHENFVKAMKALMVKYSHRQITTDQLKREFEAVVGYKLDYFFNQWYRDTGIPTFDYSSDVRQTEDGKWLATVKISQRDKENFKIVSMPVFFHFGKDKVVVKERPILKADDVYQIKLPEKPQSITLDDHHTLLADIFAQGASAQ